MPYNIHSISMVKNTQRARVGFFIRLVHPSVVGYYCQAYICTAGAAGCFNSTTQPDYIPPNNNLANNLTTNSTNINNITNGTGGTGGTNTTNNNTNITNNNRIMYYPALLEPWL